MLSELLAIDPEILQLNCKGNRIMISNRLQGRIFAAVGDRLIHRLVPELAKNPDPENFNNLGGNSLWIGPEGGNFAFNYPPQGDWYVQKGINCVPTHTVYAGPDALEVAKTIELVNRKGKRVRLKMERRVEPLDPAELPDAKYQLAATGYRSVDRWTVLDRLTPEDALLCAWSLEQLPGAEGIIGFGRCGKVAAGSLNDDFYGSAAERTKYTAHTFKFRLGGSKRLQIGVKAAYEPKVIGSFDPARGVLALRRTELPATGTYINIADNEQKTGPFGAADAYSIFNGAQELDFHELETIAPMQLTADGCLAPSELVSKSCFVCSDRPEKLLEFLKIEYGITL